MSRAKMGLALAGGGFRASLFHLGVLRRMAELDLLRHVQVLSTVSGGSIVGALYVLLLKERLEDPAHTSISREGYLEIVDELQHDLVGGIRKNLRTRLFMNPFALLKVLLFKGSLAAEMGRLYEQHVFGAARARLLQSGAVGRSGRIPLSAIRLHEAAVNRQGSALKYNLDALDDPDNPGSAVTSLILNATSLNSGARFWFSPTEIGDWYLGHVRHDEIRSELLPRKVLLDLATDQRAELLAAWPNHRERWETVAGRILKRWGIEWESDQASGVRKWGTYPAHATQLRFAHWYAGSRREREVPASRLALWLGVQRGDAATELPLPWDGPLDAGEFSAFAMALLRAEDGRLRHAKVHAWHLAHGRYRTPKVDGGMDDATRWMFFWGALESIDKKRAQRLAHAFERAVEKGAEPPWCAQLFDWIFEVYFCEGAAAISPTIEAEWDALPLADAVAASAAFPPVFPPYQLRDLYDDTHVQALSLTDGGPFDNLGVTALLDERCNYVIASDTGAPFDNRQGKGAVGRLGMMRRLSEMLMYRPAQLYRHDLHERRRMADAAAADAGRGGASALAQFAARRELRGLAAFRIGSPRLTDDSPPAADPRLIANLRTDLDLFGDVEIKCLVNEGYVMADQYLRCGLKGSPYEHPGWVPAAGVPFPLPPESKRVARILRAGSHRFFRALMLWAPLPSLVTVGAASALVAAVWLKGWEWAHVHAVLAQSISWGVANLLTLDWVSESVRLIQLKYVAALALLGLVFWLAFREAYARAWPATRCKLLRDRAGFWRKLLTGWKNAKRFKGNLLWLFKFLPLTVFAVSAVAWLSHLLFAKPFQWKTRDPEGLDR